MKSSMYSFLLYIIFLVLAFQSCELFDNKSTTPGISIYKTNSDYFDLVTIGVKDGKIFRTDSYIQEQFKFNLTNKDTLFRYRIKLTNGYILSCESSLEYDVFLNLNFKKHMQMEQKLGVTTIPHDTLYKLILDNNPYSEFFRDNSEPRKFSGLIEEIDTAEVNQIIKEGKLEQYLTRLK